MTHTPDGSRQELELLLAHQHQLVELYQAEQRRLATPLTERAREESLARLVQLSRFIDEVKNEVLQLLQTPIRPGAKGLCRKTY